MKIAYIGIDLFLPALCALMKENCEVLEIFTCETDNITEFNTEIIKIAEVNCIRYTLDRITIQDFDRLYDKGCEAVFCAGYYYKIPVYEKIPAVNIHPSLLPEGRGSWPMPYDILRKRKYSGVSIHKIAEGFDEGDILIQRRFKLSKFENLETFMEKVYALLPDMLHCVVDEFDKYYSEATPQVKGEYLPMPSEEMFTVTNVMNFETSDCILRAFYGYECFYKDNNFVYKLIRAVAVSNNEALDLNNNDKLILPIVDGYVVCDKEKAVLLEYV